jgi:uncharacterized Zn finger protein
MGTNAPALANDGRGGRQIPSSPPCAHCASTGTEPVTTMQRHTVEADSWYRCQDCGHVFTLSRPDNPLG